MKILVAVKRVVDHNIKVRVKNDHSGVELDGVKMAMNPFCLIAVEQAVRLKESGQASEVVVISIGPQEVHEQLRHGLAMGADRAIHVATDLSLEPIHIAGVLRTIARQENSDIILMGKVSVDGDNGQTGPMLAALLSARLANCAAAMSVTSESVTVSCEGDQGKKTFTMSYPAVITTDLRLAMPRFVKLPNIMKAKKKPLITLAIDTLGVDLTPHQMVDDRQAPPSRQARGVECPDANALAQAVLDNMEV